MLHDADASAELAMPTDVADADRPLALVAAEEEAEPFPPPYSADHL